MIQRARRDELLEQAAEASRTGLRSSQQRMVAGARPTLLRATGLPRADAQQAVRSAR